MIVFRAGKDGVKRRGLKMILKEHHLKYGFKTRMNQGRIMLCDPYGGTISRYPIENVMSPQTIWDDADKWIRNNFGGK